MFSESKPSVQKYQRSLSEKDERLIRDVLRQPGIMDIPHLLPENVMFNVIKKNFIKYQDQMNGLAQIESKLKRKNYEELAELVSNIDYRKVTTSEVLNISIELDRIFNQNESQEFVKNFIESFIQNINKRDDEERHQSEIQLKMAEQQTVMERQEKLAAQQQAVMEAQARQAAEQQVARETQEKEKWKKKCEEMLAALSSSDSSSDGNRIGTHEPSKSFLPSNTTNERKRKTSSGSEVEERKSPSLRGASSTTPNTPTSNNT